MKNGEKPAGVVDHGRRFHFSQRIKKKPPLSRRKKGRAMRYVLRAEPGGRPSLLGGVKNAPLESSNKGLPSRSAAVG